MAMINVIGVAKDSDYFSFIHQHIEIMRTKFLVSVLFLTGAFMLLLTACSSVRLESSYKNPDIVLFHSNKLLIVGMTRDMSARMAFESQLQDLFEKEGVEAIRSIDLFDVAFTESERSEEELDEVEQQLLDKDFDAILFTKVIGTQTRTSLRRKIGELEKTYEDFDEDYLLHQGIYYDRNQYEASTEYYAETSLHCICVGKERDLIWRSEILISNPGNVKKAIKDYIALVAEEMESKQLILGTETP